MIYLLSSVHGRTYQPEGRRREDNARVAALPSLASELRLTAALVDLRPTGFSLGVGESSAAADTPAVISGHADQLPALLTAARDAGANLAIIDTAPHSTDAALAAARAADLVLIPCRASVADLHAIGTSIEITRQAGTAAAVILNAAPVQGSLVDQARAAIEGYRGRDGPRRAAPPDCPCARSSRTDSLHPNSHGIARPEPN